MTGKKTCTLIGSDKGGVGKSLIAQIMIAAHDQGRRPLKVVEIDNQRTLTTVYGDRVDLSLDASVSVEQASLDRRSVQTHFTRVYEMWASGDSVTDLGANVTTPLMSWILHEDIPTLAQEDGIVFRFLSIAIPDDQSLRSAISSLELARRALGVDARLHLLLNDTAGLSGFAPYRETETWQRLMAMQDSHGVNVVQIPHCASAVMDWARARSLTVVQVLEKGSRLDEICAAAGWSKVERHQEVRAFISWVIGIQEAMAPLFRESVAEDHRQAAE